MIQNTIKFLKNIEAQSLMGGISLITLYLTPLSNFMSQQVYLKEVEEEL